MSETQRQTTEQFNPEFEKSLTNLSLAKELPLALGCRFDQISRSSKPLEAIIGGKEHHIGNLTLSQEQLNQVLDEKGVVVFAKIIHGSLFLHDVENLSGIKMPEVVNGDVYLGALESGSPITLCKIVRGKLMADSLYNLNGLVLPEQVNELILSDLEDIEGLLLPKGFDLKNLKIGNSQKIKILQNPTTYFSNN